MSIRKVFGTESELRLDSLDPHSDYDFDYIGNPVLGDVVRGALLSAGVNPGRYSYNLQSDWRRHDELNTRINQIINQNDSVNKNVKEHLEQRGDSSKKRDQEIYRRLGFGHNYTPSGFRLYLDGSFPEVSTPECTDPLDLVVREKAGLEFMEEGRKEVEKTKGTSLALYKNNCDRHGSSWGAHENYLITNELFESLVSWERLRSQEVWAAFLITRYCYTGSGKIAKSDSSQDYLISQRAEYMVSWSANATMHDRPIINTRDISYVSRMHGRRLHVICGDANMCETSIYLKVGMAAIVLMMLEDDFLKDSSPAIIRPLEILQAITNRRNFDQSFMVMLSGSVKSMTAIDLQEWFLEQADKWYQARGRNDHGDDINWVPDVIQSLSAVLGLLRNDPTLLVGIIDWPTKEHLCELKLEKIGCSWQDVANNRTVRIEGKPTNLREYMGGLDTAYHRLDERGLYNRLAAKGVIKRLVSESAIADARKIPPQKTRAWDRGKIVANFADPILYINWHSIFTADGKNYILDSPWRHNG